MKLGNILEELTQCHNRWDHLRRFIMNQDDCENGNLPIFGSLLQCFTCVWFHRCMIGSKFSHILFVHQPFQRTIH